MPYRNGVKTGVELLTLVPLLLVPFKPGVVGLGNGFSGEASRFCGPWSLHWWCCAKANTRADEAIRKKRRNRIRSDRAKGTQVDMVSVRRITTYFFHWGRPDRSQQAHNVPCIVVGNRIDIDVISCVRCRPKVWRPIGNSRFVPQDSWFSFPLLARS